MGRLSRNYDSGALMITEEVSQIAPLRFQPPQFPEANILYDLVKENY